jgi:acyl-CoA reductase-like NAD-dependent aldehyde dehydrogenase
MPINEHADERAIDHHAGPSRRLHTEPLTRVYDKLLIGGRWVDPSTPETLEVRSPHDRSLVGRTPLATEADVDHAVAAARAAFDDGQWPTTAPAERRAVIARFAELHAARGEELAALVTAENGTPLWFTRWLHASGGIAAQTDADLRAAETFGNALILKPSPETALDAFVLADLFAEARLPEGVLSILPAGRETSEYLEGARLVTGGPTPPEGLSGGVWTTDRERGKRVARRIRTGGMQVNGAAVDFAAPFGGYKQSGIGREFGAVGLAAYVEHKAIAA